MYLGNQASCLGIFRIGSSASGEPGIAHWVGSCRNPAGSTEPAALAQPDDVPWRTRGPREGFSEAEV